MTEGINRHTDLIAGYESNVGRSKGRRKTYSSCKGCSFNRIYYNFMQRIFESHFDEHSNM